MARRPARSAGAPRGDGARDAGGVLRAPARRRHRSGGGGARPRRARRAGPDGERLGPLPRLGHRWRAAGRDRGRLARERVGSELGDGGALPGHDDDRAGRRRLGARAPGPAARGVRGVRDGRADGQHGLPGRGAQPRPGGPRVGRRGGRAAGGAPRERPRRSAAARLGQRVPARARPGNVVGAGRPGRRGGQGAARRPRRGGRGRARADHRLPAGRQRERGRGRRRGRDRRRGAAGGPLAARQRGVRALGARRPRLPAPRRRGGGRGLVGHRRPQVAQHALRLRHRRLRRPRRAPPRDGRAGRLSPRGRRGRPSRADRLQPRALAARPLGAGLGRAAPARAAGRLRARGALLPDGRALRRPPLRGRRRRGAAPGPQPGGREVPRPPRRRPRRPLARRGGARPGRRHLLPQRDRVARSRRRYASR